VERYAGWIERHRVAVLVGSVVVAGVCGAIAAGIEITSDLASLLPSSQRSVRDVAAVEARVRPFGTIQIAIESDDVAARAEAGAVLVERLREIDPSLVISVSADDGPLHRYVWQHRFLFAELDELIAARDALEKRRNPLYVAIDEPFDEVVARMERAERDAIAPEARVSKDGRIQLVVIQTAFGKRDLRRARAVMREIEGAIAEARRSGVTLGLTGNVAAILAEHEAVSSGMVVSALITVGLCAIGLLWYYRSGLLVIAVLWSLAVGVVATFAFARVAIGSLNPMTTFLFAIVVGNGVNAGLIVVARYLEGVRSGERSVGLALRGAMRGTLAATATAAIAYGSLVVTDFRGFRQFGVIAGVGMVLTWISTFVVLPASIGVLARRGWIRVARPPAIGRVLARLMPERVGVVIGVGVLVTVGAAVVTVEYVSGNPFSKDWRDLQSNAIRGARALDEKLAKHFDLRSLMAAQAYQVAIAVERREDVASLVLRGDWIQDVRSLDDLIPRDQDAKLAVLAEIREAIDGSGDDRLARWRPPDDLRRIGDGDVPFELGWPFVEPSGATGRVVIVRGDKRFDAYDVDDRREFAALVREIELPAGAVVAGESLVVADIMDAMERDAPAMIAFALIGSVLAVLAIVGVRRHGIVTIACGLAGVVVMIALCALAELPVHFLDLIALPITIGIGIDYAVNLAARDRQDGERGPRFVLATTGGTVLLCSYTTAVGYASLLVSPNGGVRAFGLAALLGEIACIAMALLVAPALLAALRAPAMPRHPARARSG
jgi:predicted RND superfamily exporter protein